MVLPISFLLVTSRYSNPQSSVVKKCFVYLHCTLGLAMNTKGHVNTITSKKEDFSWLSKVLPNSRAKLVLIGFAEINHWVS